MLQEQLARLLQELVGWIDWEARAPDDIAVRMAALRDCGRLARGDKKYFEQLSATNLADCVLALVAQQPSYGGHASVVLGGLKPVGGLSASFMNASTFRAAITSAYESEKTLNSVSKIFVSPGNTKGASTALGCVEYKNGSELKCAYFVNSLSHTLLSQGAERDFRSDAYLRDATFGFTFSNAFLNAIGRAYFAKQIVPSIDRQRLFQKFDDAEKLADERRRHFGASHDSRFLNLEVHTYLDWPDKETVVEYGGIRIILLPETKEFAPSIHVDLSQQTKLRVDVELVVNRFLSLLCFCGDQHAVLKGGWSGNPMPLPVGRSHIRTGRAQIWAFNRSMPDDALVNRALALFREALNAEQANLIALAVLSYVKIFETRYHREDMKKWMTSCYAEVAIERDVSHIISMFEAARGAMSAGKYLYESCRVAVAHARKLKQNTDPDDPSELQRLNVAAQVLRLMAKKFIQIEMGVSTDLFLVSD